MSTSPVRRSTSAPLAPRASLTRARAASQRLTAPPLEYKFAHAFLALPPLLSRFESRPARSGQWEYYFYIDIVGHPDEPRVGTALRALPLSPRTSSPLLVLSIAQFRPEKVAPRPALAAGPNQSTQAAGHMVSE